MAGQAMEDGMYAKATAPPAGKIFWLGRSPVVLIAFGFHPVPHHLQTGFCLTGHRFLPALLGGVASPLASCSSGEINSGILDLSPAPPPDRYATGLQAHNG